MSALPDYVIAYRKHRNLKLAAREIDMTWQNLYVKLIKFGEPVVGDKAKYGSETDRFAAKAEKRFKQLVPVAVDMNKKAFQAAYDFEVAGLKVDIKCSQKKLSNVNSRQKRWAFSIKKQRLIADLVVCFGYDGDKVEKVLVVPGEICRNHSTISLSCRGGKWAAFSMPESEINEFIMAIAQAKAA